MLEKEKTLTEGAGAVGAAAVLNRKIPMRGKKLGVLISGGNIDVTLLSRIIERGLVKDGRLLRIRIHLPDHPGALQRLATVIADHKANIIETRHDRAYYGVVLGDTVIDITMETRGPGAHRGNRSGVWMRRAIRTNACSSAASGDKLRKIIAAVAAAPAAERVAEGARHVAGGGGGPAVVSFEALMPRIVQRRANANIHRKPLTGAAFVYAANRRHIAIIPPVGNAHVPQSHRLAKRRIESRPALIRNQYFRPGVRRLAADHFFLLRIGAAVSPGTR